MSLVVMLTACAGTDPSTTRNEAGSFATQLGQVDDDLDDEFGEAPCEVVFPLQQDSPYVLPVPPGEEVFVGQGNCTDGSHSEDQQFAYDVDLPIGAPVVAIRAGVVIDLEERFVDGNRTPGEENFLLVEHDDGTVAGYYHLMQDGVEVELDDEVEQGQFVAFSGDTGDSTEPHLHLEVLDEPDGDTVPVVFRNTRPHPDGLVDQEVYVAEES